MPSINLFGIDGILVPSKRPVGNLANELEVKLSVDQKLITVGFRGRHAFGEAKFSVTLACSVANDLVRLTPVSSAGSAELSIEFPLGLATPVATATARVFVTPAGELALIDAGAVLRTALRKIPIVDGYKPTSWGSDDAWPAYGLVFDLKNLALRFLATETAGNRVLRIEDNLSPGPTRLQLLALTGVTASASGILAEFRPEDDILHLHPDALTAADDSNVSNAFLYQYGLVNGVLRLTASQPGGAASSLAWQAAPGATTGPGLLLHRLSDEHGQPLYIEAAPTGVFPLGGRAGVQVANDDVSNNEQWEQTNPAIVIVGNVDVVVGAIDPQSLIPAEDPDRRWLTAAGRVVGTGRGPREIHGIARGVFLQRAAFDDTAIKATFDAQPHQEAAIGHLFTHSDLALKDSGLWKLHSQREERDVFQGLSETVPADPAIGQFVAAGKAGQTLRLPAIDTSFALANLADPRGRVTRGLILNDARTWIEGLDRQFTGGSPTAFAVPKTADDTHVSGFAISPDPSQPGAPFDSILDLPPGRAEAIGETARTPAWMESRGHHFVHGGQRDSAKHKELIDKLQESTAQFGEPFKTFQSFWHSLALDPQKNAARTELRKIMQIGDRLERTDLSAGEFEVLRSAALEILYGARRLEGLGEKALEVVRAAIPHDVTVERFRELWQAAPSPEVGALFDLLWAGTGTAVYRRAAVVELPADLRQKLGTDLATFTNGEELPGFPTPSFVGLDEGVDLFISVWDGLDTLKPLRLRFGATFTPDVYRRLMSAAHRQDLEAFLKAYFLSKRFGTDLFGTPASQPLAVLLRTLQDRWNHSRATAMDALRQAHGQVWGEALLKAPLLSPQQMESFFGVIAGDFIDFVSKLRFDPPEYIVLSSRFTTSQADKARQFSDKLWNNAFRLASLGGASSWSFLLDAESTVIVKLTGLRGIDAILKEVTASYATPANQDPLGLAESIDQFAARIDPEVRAGAWRGVFVVKPTADIGKDAQLASLTGLSDIPMIYAAIGGARPFQGGDSLDVFAAIHKERAPLSVAGNPEEDLTFTLVKFDATIRNTRLVAGEVVFRLDIRNVFGKDTSDDNAFPALFLRGTVPRDKKEGGSFEFSAWFEQPITYTLDIAFIKSFTFKSLRVGTSRGQASVEIDADILLKNWDLNFGDFAFTVGPDEGESRLSLQNFRILVPKLPKGVSISMGFPRLLNFELPAVSFTWPKPRPLTLWKGIELKPIGMGFVRRLLGDTKDLFNDLRNRYQWIIAPPEFGELAFQFPYLRCEIDFGKLPAFGGTNLSRLNLSLLLGLAIEPGKDPRIALGIGGFDGSDITIDLFGVIKLELERLVLDRFKMLNEAGAVAQEAIAIWVDNPRLTILGWSLLDEQQKLQFLLAHAEKLEKGRAAIGFYGDGAKSDSFFKLHWLLLGHNIALNNKRITQYLLSNGDEDANAAHGLLKHFVDADKKEIHATIVEDDSWLLGASFDLGEIVKPGTFVLHDQHYYGISLRGSAISALFGVKRLELCYMPGATRDLDRFRVAFRLPALDLLGNLRSGDMAIEWGFNWDFLLDFGFPWRVGAAYQWQRAFSLPMGTYEAKFGFYFEKRSQMSAAGTRELTIGAGAGFYFGYYFGFGQPGKFVWLEAGIGVFAILEGRVTFALPASLTDPQALIKASIKEVLVRGVIGIYAYGEGGIEIWVISARFRVSVQAAIAGELHYLPGGRSTLAFAATLAVGYSASCRVGCGPFSFTFSVSGTIEMTVSGQALLN